MKTVGRMMKKNDLNSEFWQAVRGICILAVIMIHCPSGIGYSDIEQECWLILRQFINFPVAIFVFMAGYFVNTRKVQTNKLAYYVNRGGRLLIPYFIWSSVYVAKDLLLNNTPSVNHILYAYFAGKAAVPFYYIVVMVQLALLTPYLVGLNNRKWLYVVTPLYLVILYAINLTTGTVPRMYETVFPAWFGFYVLGLDCREGKLNGIIEKVRNWWLFAVLVFSAFESHLLLKLNCAIGFATSQIRFGSFLYATIIIAILMKESKQDRIRKLGYKGKQYELLVMMGDFSYGIFYVHMLILMLTQKVVSFLGLTKMWLLNYSICLLLTAFGSFAIVWAICKLFDKINMSGALKILGFRN